MQPTYLMLLLHASCAQSHYDATINLRVVPMLSSLQVPASSCIMLASAVSSAALGAMTAAEGFNFEQTLTGFKWLGNIAQQRQAQGLTVLFAFEEAIGFMFPATNMVSV
jgi:phosphomannomutase